MLWRRGISGPSGGRKSPPTPPDKPRALDYFKLITSVLFVALGAVILENAWKQEGPFVLGVLGFVFITFGLYRLQFYWRYYMSRRDR